MYPENAEFWHSQWVTSGGGPLLVLPERLLGYWGGTNPPEEAIIPRSIDDISDYDRACGVEDDAGLIDVGPGSALVLGDVPDDTMWLRYAASQDIFLVRWIGADSDEVMLSALKTAPRVELEIVVESFEVPEGNLVLFDSATSGTEVGIDASRVGVEQGSYVVSRGLWKADEDTSAVLYRMSKVSTTGYT